MTLRCPHCETAYRVPARSRLGAHPTFRCSRCDTVFDPDDGAVEPTLLANDAVASDVEPGDEVAGADDDEADDADDEDAGPQGPGPSTGRFALRTLVGVIVMFALCSVYLVMHPARVTELLARIPVVGPDLAATRLDPAHIQLTDVRGEYARVQGDTLVFVITGTAVNNAAVPVNAIEIRGRIHGTGERRQRVFAGAAPRDVHDLSQREIDLLQTLQPPADWRLLPGQDGDFLIAFVDPPLPLREFSADVVAVRRRKARGR